MTINRAMFLKVGSVVWSIIIAPIVPSGKAYRNINPKYFMPLIFVSLLMVFGRFFLNVHNLDIANSTQAIIDSTINESLLAVIQVVMSLNMFTRFGFFK